MGGALARLLGAEHSARIDRLILCDCEVYDSWPLVEERPFVRVTRVPIVGDLVLRLWARRYVLRATLVLNDTEAVTRTLDGDLGGHSLHRHLTNARCTGGNAWPRRSVTWLLSPVSRTI